MTPHPVTDATALHPPVAAPPPGIGDVIAGLLIDRRRWARLRLICDIVFLCATAALALIDAPGVNGAFANSWVVSIFVVVVLAMLHGRRSPDDRLNASGLETFANVLGISSLAAMITVTVDSVTHGDHPVALTIRVWLLAVVYLGGARALLLAWRRRAMRREALRTPTLIVGAGIIGAHLAQRLRAETSYGLRPVGYLDADPLPQDTTTSCETLPVLGTPDDMERAIEQTGARHVILSFSSGPDHMLVSVVRQCEKLGVGVSLVPRLYESINERSVLDHVGGLPLLTLNAIDPRGWQFALKHLVDRVAALVALTLAGPLMLVIALAVRLSSPGPVLFRQRRVGRDGREFDVVKFRTMRIATVALETFELPQGIAPGGVEGEDRRTPLGRWLRDSSLDELPQLINVLRGDMSLVGPRPERPDYVQRFSRDVARYDDRHRVKSGITGWAQVHGLRGQTSIADRVEWDNYYIQNWSLRLDVRIVAMTLAELLRFRDTAG